MPRFKPEAQAPENADALEHAMRRMRRRRRRWMLIKLLVFLALVLAAALVYLQSSHAMKHIYLPMLSRRLGAQITAAGGSVSLGGTADFTNLDLTAPDKGRIFHADRLTVQAAPLSLLGSNPHLLDAVVQGPEARVTIDKDGRTNWDFLLPPKKQPAVAKAQSAPAPRPSAKPKEKTQVTIDRLKINSAQVQMVNAQQLDLTLTALDVSLEQFGRGRTGVFGLEAAGYLDRPGIHQTFGASGSGNVTPGASGSEMAWDTKWDARLNPQPRPGATTQTVTLRATLAGNSNNAGKLKQNFDLNASTPAGPAGRFTGNVNWDPAAKEHQALVEAAAVSRELLNPLLAMIGPVQLEQSRLDGSCKLQGKGDAIAIEITVNGNDLAFRVGERQTLTPPASIALAQHGAYDIAKKILKLDDAALTLKEKGKPVLETKLDRPVELQVGEGGAAAANVAARFNTTLTNLTVATLQPWLILAGVKQAEALKAGTLNGQLLSTVENSGATIALEGDVRGTGLRVPSWKDLPLDVNQNLKGRVEKLETITIESAKTGIASGGRPLADIETKGNFKTAGTGQATVRVVCAQAAATARTMGWLEERTISIRQDGKLDASQTITVAGAARPTTIKGAATLSGIVLAGPQSTLPLAGKADYDVSMDAQSLTIQALKAAWTAAAAPKPATLDVKGTWPMAPRKRGELKLTARGIDLAPYLKLTAQPGALTLAALPLEADETLTALEDGANKLSGEVRLGPIPPDGLPNEVDTPVSVNIKTTLDRLGEQVQRVVLELASKTHKGVVEKAAINGNGTWNDKQIALRLGGRIDQVQADGYLALLGAISGSGSKPASAKAPAAPAPAGNEPAAPAVPQQKPGAAAGNASAPAPAPPAAPGAKRKMIIDVNPLEITRLTYQKGELSEAKGTARYENGVSEIKLAAGKLCGGGIKGSAEFDATRAEPRYSWEVALVQVDVHTLGGMISPAMGQHLTGKGDIASRGTGQGLGAGAGRLLQSESGFQLTGGEIRNFFLLDALAKQTRISEFQNLQFFEFSGRVSTAGGLATLKDWVESGKDQRVSLEGTVTLDGKYDLAFQPAVNQSIAGKISKSGGLAQKLLTDSKGYVSLPIQVAVTGQGSKYQLGARAGVSQEGQAQLGENMRGLLQGVIDERLKKEQDKKNKKDEDKKKKGDGKTNEQTADEAPPAAQGGAAPPATPAPKTAVTPAPPSGGIEGILGQGMQLYEQRKQDKKDKEAEKKRKKEEEKKKKSSGTI